jgi:type II secretory pathway component PulK
VRKPFANTGCVGPNQAGVALILVVFVVALASVIVINLAYSTYIGARLNLAAQRSLQAEYLLKSALNLSSVLVSLTKGGDDSPQDIWAFFQNGVPIPADWLGIQEPNLKVQLEISYESSKLPINRILSGMGTVDPKWRDIILRLFKLLQFDDDGEKDHTGRFPDVQFKSEDMIANLIDYMDADTESYEDGAMQGREKDLPKGYFPNNGRIEHIEELARIPGFTPNRVRQLRTRITVHANGGSINLNFAEKTVIQALDAGITEQDLINILEFRKDTKQGPFKSGNITPQLESLGMAEDVSNRISPLVSQSERLFQVIAKVDYDTSSYFLWAIVKPQSTPGLAPQIMSLELF